MRLKVLTGVILVVLGLAGCQDANTFQRPVVNQEQNATTPKIDEQKSISDTLKAVDENLANVAKGIKKVTFKEVPVEYTLPKSVSSVCKAEPDWEKQEIACPNINISVADVEPKWIERSVNLAITNDDNPKLLKFRRALDKFAVSQVSDGYSTPYLWELKPTYLGMHNNLAQFAVTEDMYLGGAHGMQSETYLVYDLDLGSRIQLYDIEKDDLIDSELSLYTLATDAYDDYLKQQLEDSQSIEQHKSDYPLELTEDFYFDEQGLILHYNPYRLGPYAMGPIELIIPYRSLKGVIRDEYLPAMK
ncbi:RsiV family protein [Moraxella nasovis]|uniref:RsiV family protein n=1 Tax=Moraxella nasovis TaxID=2904121 RepID=UPI001F60FC2D|nr:RsiV family protein [Moraxella nasovis]UNU73319.1 RsiV family protein [Moraxella nasovis]